VVLSAGLVLALRPGDITRATKPWTWTPLPSTAFGSLPSPDGDAARPATPVGGRGAAVMVGGDGLDAPPATALVQAAPTPVPTPEGPTHVVASGDDLWTIARRHSADLASILRWNDGVDPDRLMAGQRILVPGGSKMQPLPKPAVVTPRVASVRPATTDRPASPQARDGDHLWPLPIRGDLTRRFSAAHPAIDIAAPQGTKVRAIAEGTVVWSGWKDNGGGFVVEILHPDGMRSTYNHNSKLTVGPGDKVAKGETVALVGSTGWSTGPHLDLRIWMYGRLVDPLRFY
jgi:murein DD-endopeptidase MepM/ murein hydrolase activator NlpD